MFRLPQEIYNNWELIWALAVKQLSVRYKRSALGFLWALLNPLMTMVILTIVFSNLVRIGVKSYAVFLISALMPWTFFSQTLSYAVESVVSNGPLLKKVRITKSVFPVSVVISNLINFLLSIIPLALILMILRFPFHWTWIYLPVATVGLILFTAGCSFFCAAANVYFRDVAHIVQIVLSGWFYLSPIVYSLDLMPHKYQLLLKLNPLLYDLNGFRLAIYYGMLPSPQSCALSLAIGAAFLVAGYMFFHKVERRFVYFV
jgi:ABC-2 type transport system permease protein